MSIYKLNNVIQNYDWGSKTSINSLFGIANPNNEPQAEIWMGAHPNGCSKLATLDKTLPEFIEQNKDKILGEYTALRFGELPYLLKVLAAETPLSIQVHPNKHKAEIGFKRENTQGIALEAANRNYKDPNHKPEMVYAITFYKAMNGFRPIGHIVSLFEEANIFEIQGEVSALKAEQNSKGLEAFFTAIMLLEGERKQAVLNQLYLAYERPAKTAMAREALAYSQEFRTHYNNDIGLLSPLFLNTIELAPGEAMFLHAQTPHAYVKGTGLEIMANSDNVLRAGLTPKHIDVQELIDNTIFEPIRPEEIKLEPIFKEGKQSYVVPVDDFCFDIISSKQNSTTQCVRGAEILFCIEGEVTLGVEENEVVLTSGESVFISNDALSYDYCGEGILARAFN